MRIRVLMVVSVVILSAVSCEVVFTTSPFAFLQRDPSRLSEEQKAAYARSALDAGDREKMAVAFSLLKDSTDPEIQLLAADLALGASGLDVAVMTALPGIIAAGSDQAALQAALDDVLMGFSAGDLALMAAAADLIVGAEASITPTPEQYVFAALGLVAVAASQNDGVGGIEALTPADPGYAEIEQAKVFLQSAADELREQGQSTEMLDGIGDAIGWAP